MVEAMEETLMTTHQIPFLSNKDLFTMILVSLSKRMMEIQPTSNQ